MIDNDYMVSKGFTKHVLYDGYYKSGVPFLFCIKDNTIEVVESDCFSNIYHNVFTIESKLYFELFLHITKLDK